MAWWMGVRRGGASFLGSNPLMVGVGAGGGLEGAEWTVGVEASRSDFLFTCNYTSHI